MSTNQRVDELTGIWLAAGSMKEAPIEVPKNIVDDVDDAFAGEKAYEESLRDETITEEEVGHDEALEIVMAMSDATSENDAPDISFAAWEARREVIRELVGLEEFGAALELIIDLDEYHASDFLVFFGGELIKHDVSLARAMFCVEEFRSLLTDPEKARLWISLYQKSGSPIDREVALGRCASCRQGHSPEIATCVFLEMWTKTKSIDALEAAKKMAADLKSWRARAQSYRFIGMATGEPEAYINAFACAGRIKEQWLRVALARSTISSIVSASFHLNPSLRNIPTAGMGINIVLTREALGRIISGMHSRRWRDALCEKLAGVGIEL